MTNDERAVREVISAWLRASEAGDTEAVLKLMADDVVFLAPGRAPFGKKEFAAAQGEIAKQRIEATSSVRDIRVSGDWAFGWTELTVAVTPEGGESTVRRRGHTLSVFQRLGDGRWVLARDANLLVADTTSASAEIQNAIASLAVRDLKAAVAWYERVLERPPDSSPMPEVAEWKFPRGGWLQLYQLPERAGRGSVTLAISNADETAARLQALGIDASGRTASPQVKTVMIVDPDGNHLAFAEALDQTMAR